MVAFKEYLNYYGSDNELKKYDTYVQNGGFSYLLNSNNRKSSVNTVGSYLAGLTYNYIIYKISRCDIKGKEYLKTGDKYYVCDLGLRNYLIGGVRGFYGFLLEILL